MPTPQDHLSTIAGGMFQRVSEGVGWTAAGLAVSAPLWKEWVGEISELAALVGPIFAVIFVASKIVLTWVQIWRTARARRAAP